MVNLLLALRHLVSALPLKTDLTSHNGTHVMRAPDFLQEVLSLHQELIITADSSPGAREGTDPMNVARP